MLHGPLARGGQGASGAGPWVTVCGCDRGLAAKVGRGGYARMAGVVVILRIGAVTTHGDAGRGEEMTCTNRVA